MANLTTNTQRLRKDILWNIAEPGDPYDIRKSMIAKFPDQKTRYMGEDLQLVCLLQAAQIERLCEYLEDFRLRYRELERRTQMVYDDRHSYQIQIKQLTQQLSGENSFRTENQKLKDYLKRQTIELQSLRMQLSKSQKYDSTIEGNYEKALQEIKILINENGQLNNEKFTYISEIKTLSSKLLALQNSHKREIQILRTEFTSNNKIGSQQEINQLKLKLSSQISRFQYQLRKSKELIQSKNFQLNSKEEKIRHFQRQLASKQHQVVKTNIQEYQNRVAILAQEVQRLNLYLREKSGELNTITVRSRDIERNIIQKDQFIKQLEVRIQNFQLQIREKNNIINQIKSESSRTQTNESGIIANYEVKIKMLIQEIERLNQNIRMKHQENNELIRKINDYDFQLNNAKHLQMELQRLRQQKNQSKSWKIKFMELQTILGNKNRQHEQFSTRLRERDERIIQYQQRIKKMQQQANQFIGTIRQLETNMSVQINNRISNYQYQIRSLANHNQSLQKRIYELTQNNQKVVELENKIALINQEYQRLTVMLNKKNQAVQLFEQQIAKYKQQLESARQKLLGFQNNSSTEWSMRSKQYQMKINDLINENKRVNNNLKAKADDNQRLQIQIKRTLEELQRFKISKTQSETTIIQEWQQKYSQLERRIVQISNENSSLQIQIRQVGNSQGNQIVNFQKENEQLRRRLIQLGELTQRIAYLQRNNSVLCEQLQRLNQALNIKVQQLNRSSTNNTNFQKQIEILRNKLNEVDRNISYQQKNKIAHYEQNITIVNRQNQQLRRKIIDFQNANIKQTHELDNARIQIQQLENMINVQWKSKVSNYEQSIIIVTRENQQLKRRFNDSENNTRSILAELQKYRKRVFQLEKLFQSDIQNKIASYKQNITVLSRENYELRRVLNQKGDTNRIISEYENKIAILNQEVERLGGSLRARSEEVFKYDTTIKNLQRQLQMYQKKIGEVSLFEQKIVLLTKERQQLLRKLNEYQNINKNIGIELESCRRKITDLEMFVQQQINQKSREYQQVIMNLRRQNEELRREQSSMSGNNNRLINQYQIKIQSIVSSYQQNISRLTSENNDLKRSFNQNLNGNSNLNKQLQNLRSRFTEIQKNFQQELRTKISTYEQQITNITNTNEELKRKIFTDKDKAVAQYENRIAFMSQQIERLNHTIRIKSQQVNNWQNRNQAMQIDIDNFRKTIMELQNLLKQETPKVSNYESTITILNQQKQYIQRSLIQLENQNGELIRKINYLQNDKKNLESSLNILKRNLNDGQLSVSQQWQSKMTSYEQKIISYSSENENLKRRVFQLESINKNIVQQIEHYKKKSFELERKVTHDLQIQIKNYEHTISSFKQKIGSFNQENQQLRRKVLESEQFYHRISDYQNKITLLCEEVDRLNQIIRNKIQEGNASQSQIKIFQSNYQQRIIMVTKEAEQYKNRLKQYENNNRNLALELENYKVKIREIENNFNTSLQHKISLYEGRIHSFTEQNNNLKRNLTEIEGKARMIPQYQNQITLLKNQIERINTNIQIKIQEINSSEIKVQTIYHELQGYKRKAAQLEKSFYSEQISLQSSMANYQNKITSITRQNQDLKKKVIEYDNRNTNLKMELENQLRRITEIQGNFGHDWQNKMVAYEKTISSYTQANQQLRIQISEYEMIKFNLERDLETSKRKVAQLEVIVHQELQAKVNTYQQRISLLTRQNQQLRLKTNECEINYRSAQQQLQYSKRRVSDLTIQSQGYQKRYSQLEVNWQKDSHQKIASYEQKIAIFSREIEQLRARCQQGGDMNRKIAEYENKIAFLKQEIQRLNQSVNSQSQEITQWQSRTRNLQLQLDNYRWKYGQLQSTTQYESKKTASYLRENEELKKKLFELQNSIQTLNFQLQNQKRKVIDYESSIEYEWKSKVSNYQHRISLLTQENEEFRRTINSQLNTSSTKIAEYENKIAILSQEIERMDLTNRGKIQELRVSENNNRKMQMEIDDLRRRVGQFQGQHSTQFQKLYEAYIIISKEYENSRVSLVEYEQNIKQLYLELDQLQTLKKENYVLKASNSKSSTWLEKNKILSEQIQRLTVLSQQQRKQLDDYRLRLIDNISLEKRISQQMGLMVVLFAEIQTLRKRVKDKQNQVDEVRRSSLAPFKFST